MGKTSPGVMNEENSVPDNSIDAGGFSFSSG
jgi:hypothetical protein